MDTGLLLLYCGAIAGCMFPMITADSVVVVSKRYTNNSYTCFARHTKDGLEYHLTYNVCFLGVTTGNSTSPGNATNGIQCLYYECSIASFDLMAADGQLACFRYDYVPPSVHQPLFDRVTAFHREWPIARHNIATPAKTSRQGQWRRKRDLNWVSFLEKFSLMGRHQSTVSKETEGYFHYNFMNKPSAGGSVPTSQNSGRPGAAPSGPSLQPPPSLTAQPSEP